MNPGILLLIIIHTVEVFVIGGVVIYCFILEKADIMDLWFIWAPVVVFTGIASIFIQRLFPTNRKKSNKFIDR